MALIEDIKPGNHHRLDNNAALRRVKTIHHQTKITTIASHYPIHRQPPAAVTQPTKVRRASPQKPVPVRQTAKSTDIKRQSFGRRLLDFVQYPIIAIFALLVAYSSTAGQIIIGIYALIALILRVDSKYTFGAALLLLIGIPFFDVLQESGVSQNCAIYAYEMLVVGTLQAIIEAWREKSHSRSV